MSYLRVIPRDLFNEANLLKCYGKLWILTEGRKDCGFIEEWVEDGFAIEQDPNTGYLTVTNLSFHVNGTVRELTRPLNSREAWPLWSATDDDDSIPVFTDNGDLSPQMIELIEGKVAA